MDTWNNPNSGLRRFCTNHCSKPPHLLSIHPYSQAQYKSTSGRKQTNHYQLAHADVKTNERHWGGRPEFHITCKCVCQESRTFLGPRCWEREACNLNMPPSTMVSKGREGKVTKASWTVRRSPFYILGTFCIPDPVSRDKRVLVSRLWLGFGTGQFALEEQWGMAPIVSPAVRAGIHYPRERWHGKQWGWIKNTLHHICCSHFNIFSIERVLRRERQESMVSTSLFLQLRNWVPCQGKGHSLK